MKRIVCLIISVILCFSLVACGGGSSTTVTEEEWASALALKNATASGFLTENGKQEPFTFKVADTVYYSENDGYTAWCLEEDGKFYMYSNDNREGQLVSGISISVGGILTSFHIPEYEKFIYDETKSAYVSQNAEYPAAFYEYNIYFEDGKIKKFESLSKEGAVQYSFNFTDYGSTEIELPDFLK